MEIVQPRSLRGRLTRALILENPDPSLDVRLRAMGIEPHRVVDTPDEDGLVALLEAGKHQLIFKRSKVEISERIIAASPDLAAVMLCCIGDDSVDKVACAKRGVLVMNDPISNGRSVAELVIGEMIMMARRVFDSVDQMAHGLWRKNNRARFEVMGKRIGILGLGNIGRQVAKLATALDMEVLFFDTAQVPQEVGRAMGYTACESMEALFAQSDFLTVHVSATDHRGRSNQGLVTYDTLAHFARGPEGTPRAFINLARGFVVDPAELRRAVEDELVDYAMTDVFLEEPRQSDTSDWTNPYLGESRILCTPHIGAATMEAQPRIARYVARTTQLLNEYGMIRNCVLKPGAAISFDVPASGAMLAVVHSDKRGTKRVVDEAIYESGANNLRSAHIDFPDYGIAYELSALDRALSAEDCARLVQQAAELTGDPSAIRWIRSINLGEGPI